MRKKLISIILLGIYFSVFRPTGCSDSEDVDPDLINRQLIGIWVGEVSETFENIKITKISTLNFKDNGNLECEYVDGGEWFENIQHPQKLDGLSYKVTGNALTITGNYIGEDKSRKHLYDIDLSGNTLKLTYKSGVRIWGSASLTINDSDTEYKFAPNEIIYQRQQ